MNITSITAGKSIQIFDPRMPEQWIKLNISAELGENENPVEATEKLFSFIDEQLKKRLPEEEIFNPIIPVPSQKETLETLKKEHNVAPK